MSSFRILVFVVAGGAACAGTRAYLYEPTDHATARMGGISAASYEVPPEQPMGTVRLAVFGTTTLATNTGAEVPVLHVRMLVANNGDAVPWTVDTRQMIVTVNGEGRSVPAFVNTDAGVAPILSIVPGSQRTIDLFYPVPAGDGGSLAAFDVSWQVHTASRPIAQRTPFERSEIDTSAYDYAYSYPYSPLGLGYVIGYGPYWSYDPLYPGAAFHHHPVFAVPQHQWVGHRFSVGPYHRSWGHGAARGGHFRGGHFGGGHSGGHHGGGHSGGGGHR